MSGACRSEQVISRNKSHREMWAVLSLALRIIFGTPMQFFGIL